MYGVVVVEMIMIIILFCYGILLCGIYDCVRMLLRFVFVFIRS